MVVCKEEGFPMIESIEFKNFKALRDTKLSLGTCTILVGPNGSGKSTVLQALEAFQNAKRSSVTDLLDGGTTGSGQPKVGFTRLANFAIREINGARVSVRLNCSDFPPATAFERYWMSNGHGGGVVAPGSVDQTIRKAMEEAVSRIRVFSLDANRIAETAPVQGSAELAADGSGLAAVLDGMRDEAPEQFKAIESHIGEWLPEFDRILFDRPQQGVKSVALRTREGQYKVSASDLSQGTLVALALLTLAYHPAPPSLIALEEPDRGVHPYLLRHIRDALYRLSHPDSCGENRKPVQVIATTHSPYFLDLFRGSPGEIVVANKVGLDVQFQRLTDQPHFQDILGEATLGEAWFSGVLGGVPSRS
jgi:predicted ATPase